MSITTVDRSSTKAQGYQRNGSQVNGEAIARPNTADWLHDPVEALERELGPYTVLDMEKYVGLNSTMDGWFGEIWVTSKNAPSLAQFRQCSIFLHANKALGRHFLIGLNVAWMRAMILSPMLVSSLGNGSKMMS